SRKQKLEAEFSIVRNNQLYRELSEEIERHDRNIAELEDVELDALEQKDSKLRELQEAERHRDELTGRHRKAESEILAMIDELAAEKKHAVENLHQLKAQFADGDPW